jgi:chitodextrinase
MKNQINPTGMLLAACALLISAFNSSVYAQTSSGVPRPDHVVIVVEENHSYGQIINSASAPYINSLAEQGALFTQSFAIEHPSQPNYLDLFSGSNQGVTTDNCPLSVSPPNLGAALIAAGFSFGGYSEDMPSVGYTGCSYLNYRRKHNPWVSFDTAPNAVPAASNMPFDGYWPSSNFSSLPTVSIVVPNQLNDMHDGTILQGDTWAQANIDPYVQWAKTHNSLLILTFDEDNGSMNNQIATIFVGPMVAAGQYGEHINHFNILRTVEEMYGLAHAGASATANPITDCWTGSQPIVPAAPTNLKATPGDSQVTLSWTASAGAASYNIYRGTASGSEGSTPIATGITGTGFADAGLSNGTTYFYEVTAVNANGESPQSNEASATPNAVPPNPVPAAPGNLAATAVSHKRINLTWADNSANEDGFVVERCTGADCTTFAQIATVGANIETFLDTGLSKNTMYSYRVRAYNSAGNSTYSNEASATTLNPGQSGP